MAEFNLSPTSPNSAPSVNLNVGSASPLSGGLDPEIGMKSQTNPLGMVGQWAEIQNQLNQNKLFQQTYQARQAIGQILSSSPDEATALKTVGASPWAAFAPELYNSLREANLANVTAQHEMQTMENEAMGQFYKSAPGALLADPGQFDTLARQNLATTPPMVRQNVSDALDSVKTYLYGGIPPRTADESDSQYSNRVSMAVQQKLVGVGYGAGMSREAVEGALGISNIEVNRGGSTAFGQRLGPALGGGLLMNGREIPNTLAPTTVTGQSGTAGNTITKVIGGAYGLGNPPSNPMTPSGGSAALAHPTVDLIHSPGPSTSPTTIMTSPSTTTQAYFTKVGDNMANLEGDLNQTVQELIPLTLRMQVERQVLSGTPDNPGAAIGGWGEERAKLAQFLQGAQHAGIPIPDSWIQTVGNKSLSNSQVFKALAATQSASQYQQVAERTGRGFQLEYKAFKDAYPNLSTDPDATNKIYNFISSTSKKFYQIQQDLMQFKHALANGTMPGYTIDDFPAWEDQKIFQGGAAFNPPTPAQQSKGTKPSNALAPTGALTVTHRWDPKSGHIVPVGNH